MTGSGNTKAERSAGGDVPFEGGDDWPVAAFAGTLSPSFAKAGSEPALEAFPDEGSFEFGLGQSEAERQLFDHRDSLNAQPHRFPPFETLAARLSEFDGGVSPPETGQNEAWNFRLRQEPDTYELWFETKFAELKSLVTDRNGEAALRAVNQKLDRICERLEILPDGVPAYDANLFQKAHLDQRNPGAAYLAEAGRAETHAGGSFSSLRRRADDIEADEDGGDAGAEAFGAPDESRAVELQLETLTRQIKEAGNKTAEAIEQLHETLRKGFNRLLIPGERGANPGRARANIRDPIGVGATPYTHKMGNGTTPLAQGRQLDDLMKRLSFPGHTKLQADLSGLAGGGNAERKGSAAAGADDPYSVSGRIAAHSDGTLPLIGIAIVAALLLLASGALFYLHWRPDPMRSHVSTPMQSLSAELFGSYGSLAASRSTERNPQHALDPGVSVIASLEHARAAVEVPAAGYRTQLPRILAAALRGDAHAEYEIGVRLLKGWPHEPSAGARWIAKAAEGGHAEASFLLASLYQRGEGVTTDAAAARGFYRQAALLGHARAMHNLGVLLSDSVAASDLREAASWFAKAADAGIAESQYNLAVILERGTGVDRDPVKALAWYRAAAATGDGDAGEQVARLEQALRQPAPAATWHTSIEVKHKKI